jgi:hypothetical protein
VSWLWWILKIMLIAWLVGPFIIIPIWAIVVPRMRQGPGWTEPLTPEAAEGFRRWPLHRLRRK